MSKKQKNALDKLLNNLSDKFGVKIKNKNIYINALTHESFCYEHDKDLNLSYEKLEFLGDSVLGLIISNFLYKNYPKLKVGDISKCKSRIVNADNLLDNAKKLRLGKYLFLGRGEEASGGRRRNSILSDSFEALIGALYLDLGLPSAEKIVLYYYKNIIKKSIKNDFDYKSALQEKIQAEYKELPHYKTLKEAGPAHNKKFEVAVYHNRELLGKGCGPNKKEAEQEAAREALEKIKDK